MKKAIISLLFFFIALSLHAQTNYEGKINSLASKIETAKTISEFDKLFEEFDTIKRTQHTLRWKAYYYAGLAQYKKAEMLMERRDFQNAKNANAIANKYAMGSSSFQVEDSKINLLLELLDIQKKKISEIKN